MSLIDLHLHTNASDGVLTPAELVQRCADAGVRLMAVTDHDSTEAVRAVRASAEPLGITVLNGVELGTDVAGGEVHLLAYAFDLDQPEFQRILGLMRDSRVGRAQQMVDKLAALGKPIQWQRVQEIAGDASIGRPHVAQALVEAGHVPTMQVAFDEYLGRNGPAYAERYQLSPADAIRLVRRAGGLPVLAHPTFVNDVEGTLPELVDAGLAGIEVYYSGYGDEEIGRFLALADRYGLLPTGGTDFHGNGGRTETGPGTVEVPWSVAERLLSAASVPIPSLH